MKLHFKQLRQLAWNLFESLQKFKRIISILVELMENVVLQCYGLPIRIDTWFSSIDPGHAFPITGKYRTYANCAASETWMGAPSVSHNCSWYTVTILLIHLIRNSNEYIEHRPNFLDGVDRALLNLSVLDNLLLESHAGQKVITNRNGISYSTFQNPRKRKLKPFADFTIDLQFHKRP